MKTPPPARILPVLEKIKSVYILWHECHSILPKTQRYSVGNRVDKLFIEIIEVVSLAGFLPKEKKLSYIGTSIRKLDTIKILLLILWETKSLDNNKYIALSLPIDEIGKMLGGWKGQINKQNSPV